MIEQKYGDALDNFDNVVAGIGGRSVYVSHGSPGIEPVRRWLQADSTRLVLVVQSRDPDSSVIVLREDLDEEKRQRLLGLTKGWNVLSDDLTRVDEMRRKVCAFLASNETVPHDPEIQRLLGFDLPLRRMALQFALQCAKEELEQSEQFDATFLIPAATVIREVEAMQREFGFLVHALDNPPADWKEVINTALRQLESPPR